MFRKTMHNAGITNGFQWINGSFTEDVETLEGRAPRDIDVLTFYKDVPEEKLQGIMNAFPEFAYPQKSKETFQVDHYTVDISFPQGEAIVRLINYWIQLFSHNRNGIWKGMVELELNTPQEDSNALTYLQGVKL